METEGLEKPTGGMDGWGMGQGPSRLLLEPTQDQGLREVEKMQRRSRLGACTRLKQTLEELVAGSR